MSNRRKTKAFIPPKPAAPVRTAKRSNVWKAAAITLVLGLIYWDAVVVVNPAVLKFAP